MDFGGSTGSVVVHGRPSFRNAPAEIFVRNCRGRWWPTRVSKEELPLCEKGESCGGCAGGLVNPTIWTDKLRSTYHIRRGEEARGIVLARWGGLGNHRYQVGFSGDVNPLAWNSFAYQPYFSSLLQMLVTDSGRMISKAQETITSCTHSGLICGVFCRVPFTRSRNVWRWRANGAQSAGQPHMNGCSTVKP